MNKARELSLYFQNMALFIIGLFLLALPLIFLTITTDAFVFPKQVALAFVTGVFFIFFALKIIIDGKLTLRNSPFDLPLLLFIVVLFLSAIFSQNRFDSLISFVPYLFAIFLYFGIVNIVKSKKQLLFVLSCLVLGAVFSSVIAVLSFFKIYILSIPATHTPFFNTIGSLFDQAIYLALVLPIAGQFIYRYLKAAKAEKQASSPFEEVKPSHLPKATIGTLAFFGVSFVIILAGLAISVYALFTTQKPIILPLEFGLQTALAAISQDAGHVLKSFLLGSGIGTYLVDFTRFKAANYNALSDLWAFTFFRSSTFVLELVATAGVLGAGSFIFLVFRIFRQKSFFPSLLLAILAAFVLPFSFTITLLFFILLAIFAVDRIASGGRERTSEIEFYFVAFKRKFFGGDQPSSNENEQKRHGRFLSIIVLLILLVFISAPLYFAVRYLISDLIFQQALVAASRNQGTQTYDLEVKAIKMFPYRDVYYRAFSQTNLALANLLVSQNKGGQLSSDVQQNILTLIQQSINAGRSATNIAPLTAFNWNNLSSIYRSLIGFGQNADQFTLLTARQAISLDQNNPQQYIEYGGIYYQLGNYDEAIRQFQFAISLKQDYANAYYNLGHALELKGNLNEAMQAYQIVKRLVVNDKTNTERIDADIKALQDRIGKQPEKESNVTSSGEQQPLNVNKPTTQLPERKPPVEIPGPTISPTPTQTEEETPTPTEAP